LLPKLSGLNFKEMLALTNLAYSEPEIDCVFLSHAHFDHITHIQFLDPAIPVCMGVGTKLFMESMEETGFFADYGQHVCNKFRTGHKIKIGDLTVEHRLPLTTRSQLHTDSLFIPLKEMSSTLEIQDGMDPEKT
jgi:phosphoribosyl 1,2-cyclic phosphodiesterase